MTYVPISANNPVMPGSDFASRRIINAPETDPWD